MNNCLLCNSAKVREVANVDSKKIVKLYLKALKSDFSYLFKDEKIRLVECDECGLRFFDPQVAGDEQFYGTLQQFDWYYRKDKEEYTFASKFIKDSDSVLDVGCGQGEFKKYIGKADFTGLEFSPDAIAKGVASGRKILNEPIEEHAKTNSEGYDVVASFQVLEHVTKVAAFVKSCAQCVKPGGYLIIAVPSEESFLHFGTNFFLNMPPHHISRWNDKTLLNIAELINFQFCEIHHDSMDHLHVDAYFTAAIERALPFKKHQPATLVDDSLSWKIRSKVAYYLGKKFSRTFNHPAWLPKGQNVTIVYQKPVSVQ